MRSGLLRLNRPSNYTGLPAISIPCGFTSGNLPVGLQLIGRAFNEGRLLQIARAYEKAHDWHLRRPPPEGSLAGRCVAVLINSALIGAGDPLACNCRRSATVPAVSGVAIDVPPKAT